MTTYVMRNGELVEKSQAAPLDVPYVISDEISPTRHMADGKYYTSKRRFRQATKDAGCIEVGTETATVTRPRAPIQLDRRKRIDDIRRAVYELQNRK